MKFDWWTFGFQMINVLILIWLLNHFLFKPVAGIIARRQAETDRVLEEAGQSRLVAEQAAASAQAEIDRQAAERASLLEVARADAERQTATILDETRLEAARLLKSADAKAARIVAKARTSNAAQTRKLALTIAGKLIDNLPADARTTGYPDRLADVLKDLGDDEKSAVFDDEQGVRLISPVALKKSQLDKVKRAISAAAGKDVQVVTEIDPGLVAGLELRSRHGVIHNSLNADLDQISKALLGNEKV